MKCLFIMPAMLFAGILGYSQSISYTYDDSGNRIERSITLKSTSPPENQFDTDMVVEDDLGALNITIYPNPVRSELTIEMSAIEEPVDVSVLLYDQGGRLVLHEDHITGTTILHLGNLMSGNYYMIIQSGDRSTRWKIVKE